MTTPSPVSSSHPPIILASSSPRRRQLLAALGLPFTVVPVDVPEDPLPGERPIDLAKRLALAKAQAARGQLADGASGLIIGADTVVVDRGRPLGKPASAAEAMAMLRRLRGRTHQVVSGVALVEVSSGRAAVAVETTRVHLRPMTDEEIARYVATGDPLDKAGAYAIQNVEFQPVEWIDGCESNVIGLPLCTLAALLDELGIQVPPEWRPDSPGCACARRRSSAFRRRRLPRERAGAGSPPEPQDTG